MDVQGSLFGLTTSGGELGGGTLYRLSNVAGTWQPAAFSFSYLTGQLRLAQGSNVIADTKGHVFACLAGGIYDVVWRFLRAEGLTIKKLAGR